VLVGHKPNTTVGVSPDGYPVDPERGLSATPATLIRAVDGVGDRSRILSMA
jgi:hypothetical protein